MGTGNDNNNWGANLNNNVIQILIDAVTNVLTESVSGGTLDLSGSAPPAAPSQVHYESITVTGTLGSNQVIKVPNLAKRWRVNNNLTLAGFALSFVTPGGSGGLQALGAITGGSVYTNGTYTNVPLTGGSGSGATANITVAGTVVSGVTIVQAGSGYLTTDTLSASSANIGGTGSGFSVAVSTVANVVPAGGQEVRCDGAGNISVSAYGSIQAQLPDASAAAPSHSFLNEPSSGLYRHGPQDIRLAIAGTDILQITGSGASTPSVMNLLAGALQIAGVQVVPSGVMVDFGGILAPSGWYLCAGQAITRSGDASLLAALTVATTGNTHSNTTLDGIAGLTGEQMVALLGANIEGTGIQSGTTIQAIISPTSCTLSLAATTTVTGLSIRFFPYGNGDGSTTFNMPDHKGRAAVGRDNMNFGGFGTQGRLTSATISPQAYAQGGTGGNETITLTTGQIPAHTHNYSGTTSGESAAHNHSVPNTLTVGSSGLGVGAPTSNFGGSSTSGNESATHVHSYSGTTDSGTGGGAAHNNVQPTAIVTKIIKR
jgi:microcystin-dependent protein